MEFKPVLHHLLNSTPGYFQTMNTRFRYILLAALSLPVWGAAQSPVGQPAPGRLVDIGGYRLHMNATGKGQPVVVLIAGANDFSVDWGLVQPAVARFTQVCSYDRAGLAWCDLGPLPRTMQQDVFELHQLLKKANLRGPYVLVGHSIGGLIARLFAQQYPTEVAGMVLVDATSDDTQLLYQGNMVRVREGATGKPIPGIQTIKSSPPKPPTEEDVKQAELNRQVFGAPRIEPPFDKLPLKAQQQRLWALNHPKLTSAGEDFWAEELQLMYQQRVQNKALLGTKPLRIMLADTTKQESPPEGISPEEWPTIRAEKVKQKVEVAALSTNSNVIGVAGSGHHIQLDQPGQVVQAIREVVNLVKRHTQPD